MLVKKDIAMKITTMLFFFDERVVVWKRLKKLDGHITPIAK